MKLDRGDLQAITAGLMAGLCAAAMGLNYKDWQFYLFTIVAAAIFLLLVRQNEN